jgi:hypothetical protein
MKEECGKLFSLGGLKSKTGRLERSEHLDGLERIAGVPTAALAKGVKGVGVKVDLFQSVGGERE